MAQNVIDGAMIAPAAPVAPVTNANGVDGAAITPVTNANGVDNATIAPVNNANGVDNATIAPVAPVAPVNNANGADGATIAPVTNTNHNLTVDDLVYDSCLGMAQTSFAIGRDINFYSNDLLDHLNFDFLGKGPRMVMGQYNARLPERTHVRNLWDACEKGANIQHADYNNQIIILVPSAAVDPRSLSETVTHAYEPLVWSDSAGTMTGHLLAGLHRLAMINTELGGKEIKAYIKAVAALQKGKAANTKAYAKLELAVQSARDLMEKKTQWTVRVLNKDRFDAAPALIRQQALMLLAQNGSYCQLKDNPSITLYNCMRSFWMDRNLNREQIVQQYESRLSPTQYKTNRAALNNVGMNNYFEMFNAVPLFAKVATYCPTYSWMQSAGLWLPVLQRANEHMIYVLTFLGYDKKLPSSVLKKYQDWNAQGRSQAPELSDNEVVALRKYCEDADSGEASQIFDSEFMQMLDFAFSTHGAALVVDAIFVPNSHARVELDKAFAGEYYQQLMEMLPQWIAHRRGTEGSSSLDNLTGENFELILRQLPIKLWLWSLCDVGRNSHYKPDELVCPLYSCVYLDLLQRLLRLKANVLDFVLNTLVPGAVTHIKNNASHGSVYTLIHEWFVNFAKVGKKQARVNTIKFFGQILAGLSTSGVATSLALQNVKAPTDYLADLDLMAHWVKAFVMHYMPPGKEPVLGLKKHPVTLEAPPPLSQTSNQQMKPYQKAWQEAVLTDKDSAMKKLARYLDVLYLSFFNWAGWSANNKHNSIISNSKALLQALALADHNYRIASEHAFIASWIVTLADGFIAAAPNYFCLFPLEELRKVQVPQVLLKNDRLDIHQKMSILAASERGRRALVKSCAVFIANIKKNRIATLENGKEQEDKEPLRLTKGVFTKLSECLQEMYDTVCEDEVAWHSNNMLGQSSHSFDEFKAQIGWDFVCGDDNQREAHLDYIATNSSSNLVRMGMDAVAVTQNVPQASALAKISKAKEPSFIKASAKRDVSDDEDKPSGLRAKRARTSRAVKSAETINSDDDDLDQNDNDDEQEKNEDGENAMDVN